MKTTNQNPGFSGIRGEESCSGQVTQSTSLDPSRLVNIALIAFMLPLMIELSLKSSINSLTLGATALGNLLQIGKLLQIA